ncbi:MAG TPA: hypothetical protein VNW46_05205 [Gemmatimonadaceae bacterium]|nr:hypothetical protein [Gemmatimonadaceae bacterium]
MMTPRTLYALAAGFGLVGATLAISPPLRPTAASPSASWPHPAPVRRLSPTAHDTNVFAGIAATDVFSDTRTPPAVRFTPDPIPTRAPVVRRVSTDEPTVHLSGIAITPRGATALIGSAIYRVGDRVGGGSVAAITDSTVVIERAHGPLVLRLPLPRKPRP